jgi:hypothetical protein
LVNIARDVDAGPTMGRKVSSGVFSRFYLLYISTIQTFESLSVCRIIGGVGIAQLWCYRLRSRSLDG